MAYGLFPAPAGELDTWRTLDEVSRASMLINTYENLLSNRTMPPAAYLDRILGFAEQATNPLILDLLLDQIRQTYWLLLDEGTRAAKTLVVETVLWDAMLAQTETSERKTLFLAFVDIALTPRALARAQQVWAGDREVVDLPLGEDDRIEIAQTLAVKLPIEAESIIDAQIARTENPDNVRMLEFIRPSLSPRQEIRDRFFESLASETNRESELWVLTALENLHHPLRARQSERYIVPSLELLQEIQVTGDVFFPKRWLDATLGNYRSESAVKSVRSFLEERPDYNEQLRMKILQSADMLFRANGITSVAD
jgi:aminopeptidase N